MEIQGHLPVFTRKPTYDGTKISHQDKTDEVPADVFQKETSGGKTDGAGLITPDIPGVKPNKDEYIKEHREAKLIKTTSDGRLHLSGIRWGFDEGKKAEDWNPRWKEASIDPSRVKDAYIVLELYPDSFPGHAMTYFEFDDKGKVQTPDGESTKGLAMSFEAHLKKDQQFDAVKGLKNEFGVIYQLGSWEDQVQKVCGRDGHSLIRFKLNLSQDQKEKLLRNSLDASTADRTGEFYNTINNSCFNSQVRLINTVLPPHQQVHEWIIPGKVYNPATVLPRGMSPVLGFKGILDDSAPVLTQPDKEKYPAKQVGSSFIRSTLNTLSKIRGVSFLTGLAGVAAGAAAGSMIPFPILGSIAGGILGGVSAYKSASWAMREGRMEFEPAEKYINSTAKSEA